MLKRQECGFRCEEVSQSVSPPSPSLFGSGWGRRGEKRGGGWMDETWMVDECNG